MNSQGNPRYALLLKRNRAARRTAHGPPRKSKSTVTKSRDRPPAHSQSSPSSRSLSSGSSSREPEVENPERAGRTASTQCATSLFSSHLSQSPRECAIDDPDGSDKENGRVRKQRRTTLSLWDVVEWMEADLGTRKVSPELEQWHIAVRGTSPLLTPFLHANLAFSYGLDIQANPDEEEDRLAQVDREQELDEDDLVEFQSQCDHILNVMPNLKADIEDLLEDPVSLRIYGKYITSRAAAMRGDHIGGLNGERIMQYIAAIPGPHYAERPGGIPHHIRKVDRGWFNAITGRLLCPLNQLDVYDTDPEEFCTRVRNGDHVITADDYPSFLFDLTVARDDDPAAGLFQGPFLEKVARTLFTGPGSATDGFTGRRAGRPPFVHTYELTRTEPRMIVYAALLARHALNSQDQWRRMDISFDGSMFVKMLLIAFKDEHWKREVLAWWDKKLFGHVRAVGAVNGGKPRPNSMAARLAAKVAAASGRPATERRSEADNE